MEINIYHLIDGAKQAEGLTVIIDVFRAFSLECYLFDMGVKEIRPVGSLEEAFAWRERDPECLLVGERGGVMCEGFDFGNSPSSIVPEAVRSRRVIHTTSAGTQGIVNAV
ncbi:MAG: 2-phosphosulfolactate phosphatase, partial [Lachnospiraceae bacterium]|nr:2-phosphosulfolactate phosphatase [Lachnospiraceae bacterium]